MSKTSHDGTDISYEGIVERLTLDDEQKVVMMVLSQVDRFTIRIEEDGTVKRHESGGDAIPWMQLAAPELANVAFEILTLSGMDANSEEPVPVK